MGMNPEGPYHQTSVGFEGRQQPGDDDFIYEQT